MRYPPRYFIWLLLVSLMGVPTVQAAYPSPFSSTGQQQVFFGLLGFVGGGLLLTHRAKVHYERKLAAQEAAKKRKQKTKRHVPKDDPKAKDPSRLAARKNTNPLTGNPSKLAPPKPLNTVEAASDSPAGDLTPSRVLNAQPPQENTSQASSIENAPPPPSPKKSSGEQTFPTVVPSIPTEQNLKSLPSDETLLPLQEAAVPLPSGETLLSQKQEEGNNNLIGGSADQEKPNPKDVSAGGQEKSPSRSRSLMGILFFLLLLGALFGGIFYGRSRKKQGSKT